MSPCEVTLNSREDVAEGTMAFHFDKPPGFSFKAGQAVELILGDSSAPGSVAENARHAFSLVSAPFERRLTVATRMRDSAFKRALKALPIGARIQLDGPFGSLTLHHNRSRPAILIAGGIGITPFICMLRQATHDQLPQRLILLYSNRRPEDAAFLSELQGLATRNPNFLLVATMTQMDRSSQPWTGERGAIGSELVRRIAADLTAPICYLAGPPTMVAGVRETLNAAGIDDDDVRAEEFFGY